MKVARMNFFLGPQKFVDCLRRHVPTIQIAKMTVTVPITAMKIEDKATKLAGLLEIFGTKPTANDGNMTTPTVMR